MDRLFEIFQRKLRNTKLDFSRFLLDEIDWTQRLIAIKGARGVGKTTLLLQYIKLNLPNDESVLYASLDDWYFTKNSLVETAEEFVKQGGQYLFLDEVHKYPNWSIEIKNLYDQFDDLKIVFTASSILEIYKGDADLSRRAVAYLLPGLSLREYISLQYQKKYKTFNLDEIIENHGKISQEISSTIKPLKMWKEYTKTGYYPYFTEGALAYPEKVNNTINAILEVDLPNSRSIDYQSVYKLKQLLYIISESVPFKPNISKLSNILGITRPTLLQYLSYMEKAQLINMLRRETKGISLMSKPEKIFLQNSNLFFALNEANANIGNLRESFFLNQLSQKHEINYTDPGDFLIDGKMTFEVGGKNKTNKQIKGISNAYIAADNIETGRGNKIPLWLFGFLY